MGQGCPYLCLPAGIARGKSEGEQGRKRSQVWDSPQPPGQPPPHTQALTGTGCCCAAASGPAWPGLAWAPWPCPDLKGEEGNEQWKEKGMPISYPTQTRLWHQLPSYSPLPAGDVPLQSTHRMSRGLADLSRFKFLEWMAATQGCSRNVMAPAVPSHGFPIPRTQSWAGSH